MWRGALLLADYILFQRDLFQGRTVLELGAGTGLASIIAATVAQTVYCTGKAPPSRATGELFLHKGCAYWIKEGGRETGNPTLAALDSALLPGWFSPPSAVFPAIPAGSGPAAWLVPLLTPPQESKHLRNQEECTSHKA